MKIYEVEVKLNGELKYYDGFINTLKEKLGFESLEVKGDKVILGSAVNPPRPVIHDMLNQLNYTGSEVTVEVKGLNSFRDRYKLGYHSIAKWVDGVKISALKKGYTESLVGFRDWCKLNHNIDPELEPVTGVLELITGMQSNPVIVIVYYNYKRERVSSTIIMNSNTKVEDLSTNRRVKYYIDSEISKVVKCATTEEMRDEFSREWFTKLQYIDIIYDHSNTANALVTECINRFHITESIIDSRGVENFHDSICKFSPNVVRCNRFDISYDDVHEEELSNHVSQFADSVFKLMDGIVTKLGSLKMD